MIKGLEFISASISLKVDTIEHQPANKAREKLNKTMYSTSPPMTSPFSRFYPFSLLFVKQLVYKSVRFLLFNSCTYICPYKNLTGIVVNGITVSVEITLDGGR